MAKSGFNFFVNAYEVSPIEYAAWKDIDVSQYLPAGATGVIVQLVNRSEAVRKNVAVRKKGSTDDFTGRDWAQKPSGYVYNCCGVDTNKVFQGYLEDSDCEIWLTGYTDDAVTFFTNMVDKTTESGGWVNVNVSDIVSLDATGVICQFLNKEGISTGVALIRQKGSTDDELDKNDINGPVDALCGLNESKIFQQKIGDAAVELYVKGYTKPPVKWFTNVVKKGPVTEEAVFEDIDVSGDVGSGVGGVIVEVVNFNTIQNPRVVLRQKGSTDNRVEYDDRIGVQSHIWVLVGLNDEGIFQVYVKKTDVSQELSKIKFYIHGFVKWEGMLKTKLEKVNLEAS